MVIGIDGNEANVDNRVGIGEYAFELLKQFHDSQFPIPNSQFDIYLKSKPLSDMPKEREGWKYIVFGPKRFWTQFALPLKLYATKSRPDIYFSPTHYGPRFSPVRSAISIMDMSFIHFPYMFKQKDLYQLRSWTAYSAKAASLIFTISNSSKNDIIKAYNVPEKKVIVTPLGIKQDIPNVKNIKRNRPSSDFILFVGTLQPRKNIKRLIEAFSRISDKKIKLLIVGKKGWQYEEILDAPKEFGVSKRVEFLDFVSDEELTALYKDARCFVLPSLYEGFGLPILEAMKYGCPVITSSVSSMPEAGGDACLYIDPKNSSDITAKIDQLLSDDKLREELIEKGYRQVKKFSWEKTAQETLKALESIANSK